MTLQHVALETRRADGDAEVAWWGLLGFAEVEPPPTLRDRARWVQRGPTQIHFLFTDDPVVAPKGHVAVVCEDAERVVPTLGDDVEERQAHWGARRWYARTPGGHRVEVMAAPPA